MKKIFTTLFALSASIFVFGQSIHIFEDKTDVTNGVITVKIAPGELAVTKLSLLNTTNKHINYQVNRTILNPPFNDSCASVYFCSGTLCYPPSAAITWTPQSPPIPLPAHGTMPNGAGSYGITADYEVCPTVCNDLTVYYRVYDTEANTKDTAHVTIKYTCTNGIKEQSKAKGHLSDAYPNPASANFSFNYQLNEFSKSTLVIQDVVGKKIQEIDLHAKEGLITINTSQLSPGIYFYSLIMNGRQQATKKIVVN